MTDVLETTDMKSWLFIKIYQWIVLLGGYDVIAL